MLAYRRSKFLEDACYEIKATKYNTQLMLKLLTRRFKRLPPAGKCLAILLFSLFTLFVMVMLVTVTVNLANTSHFLLKQKCPACFGFKACDKIENGDISLTLLSNFKAMFVSSVRYYGKTRDGTDVILTKLGNSSEIKRWEKLICSKAKKSAGCDVAAASQKLFPLSGSKWIKSSVYGRSLMTTCPTERLVNSMQFRYTETLDAIDMSARERVQMVLTLWRSQEPLVYQMFPNKDNWPFAKYIGSCGRVLVYESPGEPLYNFRDEPWTVRAELAVKILTIAHRLTENPSKYGIYMLNVGFDTFHVNTETMEVLYTSPEDILVVDRWQIGEDRLEGWNKPHTRNSTRCKVANPRYSMSCSMAENWRDLEEMCTKQYSDHNYYAVCRNIISPVLDRGDDLPTENVGLLKGIPEYIDKLYGVKHLINRCLEPLPNEYRSEVTSHLRKTLKKILSTQSLDQS